MGRGYRPHLSMADVSMNLQTGLKIATQVASLAQNTDEVMRGLGLPCPLHLYGLSALFTILEYAHVS